MYRPFYWAERSALFFSTDRVAPRRVFSGARNAFVCGALQDPARMAALLGSEPPFAPAVATGYRRIVERVGAEEIPFMAPDPGDPPSVLTGVVWLGLAEESLARIESLELDRGLRKRITVEVRVGELTLTAYTYVKR